MAICRMNGMSIQRIESRYAISAKCNLGEDFALKICLKKRMDLIPCSHVEL